MRLMDSILFCGVLLIGIACRSIDLSALPSPPADLGNEKPIPDGLEIYIFEFENLSQLGSLEFVRSLSENNLSGLTRNDLMRADVIITEEDIVTFDWTTQKIILSDSIRQQYISKDLLLPPFSVFVVSFDGKPLFSGKLLWVHSATYFATPTLYVSSPVETSNEDELAMYIRPHSVVYLEKETEGVLPIDDQNLAERIRDHLELNGK